MNSKLYWLSRSLWGLTRQFWISFIVGCLAGSLVVLVADARAAPEKVWNVPDHVLVEWQMQLQKSQDNTKMWKDKYEILSKCIHENIKTQKPVLLCFTVCNQLGRERHPEVTDF